MSSQAALKTPRFDTRDTHPALRRKAWADALNEHIYSFDTEYLGDFQAGTYEGVDADEVRIATITSDPLHVERRRTHIARELIDAYLLIMPAGGDLVIGQRGREVTVHWG